MKTTGLGKRCLVHLLKTCVFLLRISEQLLVLGALSVGNVHLLRLFVKPTLFEYATRVQSFQVGIFRLELGNAILEGNDGLFLCDVYRCVNSIHFSEAKRVPSAPVVAEKRTATH